MINLHHVSKYFDTNLGRKYILNDVSLTIPSGVNIGILGRNGAGKTTLLRMLGGIDFPNEGLISSEQSFSWPMGLGGGFQGSMTGRQNIKFVCRIYGKSEAQIKKIAEEVAAFSELGAYFDMPIKTYSSGMKSRLSFGLSLAFDFDYLIIDETLAVGDKNFQAKSKAALRAKIENCHILLASHAMPILRELCDAGIVVNNGMIDYYENIDDAINAYESLNALK
jgi:capsular polysaccharide transport system ATP-binding protein